MTFFLGTGTPTGPVLTSGMLRKEGMPGHPCRCSEVGQKLGSYWQEPTAQKTRCMGGRKETWKDGSMPMSRSPSRPIMLQPKEALGLFPRLPCS